MNQGSPRSSRGPYAKGVARRRALLDAAREIYAQGGWESTSLLAVADAAGVSREAARHYFPNRTELLIELLKEMDGEAHASASASSGDKGIAGHVLAGLDHTEASPVSIALTATLTAHAIAADGDGLKNAMRERLDALEAETTQALRAAQSSGQIRTDIAPDVLARLLLGASDGIAAHSLLRGEPSTTTLRALVTLLTTPPPAEP